MGNCSVRNSANNLRVLAFFFVVACLMMAAPSSAVAQAGSLDPTFGVNGIFSDNFVNATGFATVVALQSDGKIVAAGASGTADETAARGVVLRLNTNGTLDTSFGSSGVASMKFGDIGSFANGLAIQSDGKILVIGSSGIGGGQLVRLNTNGSFDTTFGNGGFASGFSMTAGAMVLLSSGEIVVVGAAPGVAQMQRFTSSGQLDTTFGTAGTAPLVFFGNAITVLSNGKLLVTSGGILGGGTVVRYTSNGALDTTFGISGQASALAAPGLALQSNGRIVTAGSIVTRTSSTGNPGGFGLVRLTANGVADATFGTRGGVVTAFPNFFTANAFPVAIQSNGDIVAAGTATNGSGNTTTGSFALARYLSTGALDTSFGTGGLVTTSFGSTTASIGGIVIQTDGKIVVAGGSGTGNFVVARYLGQ